MQVTETLAEGLKHEFKISVPASDLDAKADAKLVDLKDKVKLNGFRPGKAPVSHPKKADPNFRPPNAAFSRAKTSPRFST